MRWTTWSPPGRRNGLTSTSSRCRYSAGCPGWPGTWTGPARLAFASHGLEPWEFDVLSALRRQGPPYQLSPGALLHITLVTSGTMTNRIDRLEQAGLVARRPDQQDKRGVLVRLTAEGTKRVDAALADLLTSERAFLHPIPEDSRRTLADLLRDLLAPLDAQ